jgi:endonuclease/exonuclease/phosphatase family metal-dependent hydrolase
MRRRQFFNPFAKRALVLTGAVFCAGLALVSTSCGKKGGTPDWDTPGGGATTAAAVMEPSAAVEEPAPAPKEEPASPPETPAPANAATQGLRFISYNLENWLTMDRYDPATHKVTKNQPKPDSQKKAAVAILAKNAPDVLGICEIGEAKDLAEVQESLKAAGLDLPHSQYVGGTDPVRHLALLSRFPITATAKPAETEYKLDGKTFGINRSILDATIQARGKTYRFIGVHLKSKRDVEEADQEQMRIHEAHLLRRHLDSVFTADANARLIVYGDFNDTRPSKAFKSVTGSFNDPGYLTALPLKDSRGEAWTHYWALHEIYSRIDFITVSRAIRPEVDFHASHIIDDPKWNDASDHRPVLGIFK